MKITNKNLFAIMTTAFAMLASSSADAKQAPTTPLASITDILTDPTYLDGSFSFQGVNGQVKVDYSGPAPVAIAVGVNNISSQDYATVGNAVETVFHLSKDAFVGNAGQLDTINETTSFVSSTAYRYLAIHFGQHEAFFDFGANGVAAGTAFDFSTTGPAAGLSNFRAYTPQALSTSTTTVSASVPEPSVIWLLASGLLSLFGFRKMS